MTTRVPADGYYTSGDLRMHYLDWGNEGATPLVLLHHISSHAHTWDAFAMSMASRYRVIALDMRGHGDSAWAGEGNYTTEHYASDVGALIDHLRLRKVVFLGGSTGGRVALVSAAQHPDTTAALIMEDVGAVRPLAISQGFATRVAGGDPQFDTVEEWARSLQGQNTRTPPEYFRLVARHGTRRLPNGKLGLKRDILIQRDFVPLELWRYVEKVKAPFLLLVGTESQIVGQDQQTRFTEIRPDIEIVTVPGAGHIIVHDRPQEFERIVQDFLARRGV